MSKGHWLLLWLLFIGYLFLGATLFYQIQHPIERQNRLEDRIQRNQVHDQLKEHFTPPQSEKEFEELLDSLSDYCGKPLSKIDINNDDETGYKWTYYNSFFYSLITVTTVGYGNITPSSTLGRMVMIVYSLLGVPFLSIVMGKMGEVFGRIFMKAHHRYKNHGYESKWALVLVIVRYLVLGIFIFLVAPAGVICYMEDWPYSLAFYYSYVTLTTIGYGDFVAGQQDIRTTGYAVYQIAVLVWMIIGLGYLVMILGFISRAYRSKRLNRLEKKLTTTIKQTHSRIWGEFMEDISYVRRVLNEMYLLKVKPVYKESELLKHHEHLSQSCPNLSEWPVLRKKQDLEPEVRRESLMADIPLRRRAYSENVAGPYLLHKVASEGDLDKIDRKATFSNTVHFDRGQMLAKVVDILATPIDSSDDEDTRHLKESLQGIDMFSEEEILASETQYSSRGSGSTWMLGDGSPPSRGRTLSEGFDHQYLHSNGFIKKATSFQNMNGDAVGKEEGGGPPSSGLRRMSAAAISFLSSNSLAQKLIHPLRGKGAEKPSCPPDRRFSLQDTHTLPHTHEENYITFTPGQFPGLMGRRPSLLAALVSGKSMGSEGNISPILEQTSVADLIRAMKTVDATPVHKRVNSLRLARRASLRSDLQRRRYSQMTLELPTRSQLTVSSDSGIRRRGSRLLTQRNNGAVSSRPIPSFVVTPPNEQHDPEQDESLTQVVVRL